MNGEKNDSTGKNEASTAVKKSSEAPVRPRSVTRVQSQALLGKHGQLIIEHAGREYVLRRTSTGKLILTA